MYINQIGHFYFGKNRTFLNWLDIELQSRCKKEKYVYIKQIGHFYFGLTLV